MKDIITDKTINVGDFRDAVFQISKVYPAFTKEMRKNWQEVRTMVRSIHKKYQNEENHNTYNSYINLAREHFRNFLAL